jgi:hypothetical protein
MADLNKSMVDGSTTLSQSPPSELTRKTNRQANNVSLSEDATDLKILKPKNIKIKKKSRKQVAIEALSDNDDISSSDQIDNEIDKLRQENSRRMQKVHAEKILSKSYTPHTSSDLAAKSLTASSQFDTKLQHIETYSKIIENATLNMDACVKDMSDVYQNYETLYQSADVEQDLSTEVTAVAEPRVEESVYDDSTAKSIELVESSEKEAEKERPVLFYSSSMSSLHTYNTTNDETRSDSKYDKDQYSVDSKVENENNYLDDTNYIEDLRQDIR